MTMRTVTQSLESDAEPDTLFSILIDPKHLPQWAPGFAERVEADEQGGWRITKGDTAFLMQVITTQASRSVDYVREIAPGRKGGAYLRVLPRPNGGSVVVMTLPIPPGQNAEQVTAILNQELISLVQLCSS